MRSTTHVFGSLFIASVIFSFAAGQPKEKFVRKSSLILEYNWPEPSKSLDRLPHPHSCHHFIHTKHDGTHVVKRCHGDKVFDYRRLRCENKSSAKCWMNIVKQGNLKKIKRPFSCPFPWGLYPDKEDCSLFYNCLGGKVYPRKCPDSTLFDVVERICVHSKKALCAGDSDDRTASQQQLLFKTITNEKEITRVDSITAAVPSESSGIFSNDLKQKSSEEENSSEEKDFMKSKNRFLTSKLPFPSTSTANPKSFRITDSESEENSSEEENSLEEEGFTKSKNRFLTSKLPFPSTSTVNPKSFRTTDSESEENSSEEENISEEEGFTKSKNKFLTSKLPFPSTSTANHKSLRTTNSQPEENSSKEENDKISSKYKLKSTTSKIQTASDSTYGKETIEEIIPVSIIKFTENNHITKSSQDSHSSELLLLSSTTKSQISTGNKLKPELNTKFPKEITEIVVTTNGDTEKVSPSLSTKKITEELTSSVETVSHDKLKPVTFTVNDDGSETDNSINDDAKNVLLSTKIVATDMPSTAQPFSKIDLSTKIPSILGLSTIQPIAKENTEIETKTASTFSILCSDSDGHFPHPTNRHLFVICVGGQPTIMKCPENLVYDSTIKSCNYDNA